MVVAVIGVLVALLLPAVQAAREDAQVTNIKNPYTFPPSNTGRVFAHGASGGDAKDQTEGVGTGALGKAQGKIIGNHNAAYLAYSLRSIDDQSITAGSMMTQSTFYTAVGTSSQEFRAYWEDINQRWRLEHWLTGVRVGVQWKQGQWLWVENGNVMPVQFITDDEIYCHGVSSLWIEPQPSVGILTATVAEIKVEL